MSFAKQAAVRVSLDAVLALDHVTRDPDQIIAEHAARSNGMLTLFFLPPYSPDLNPDEWVWKNVKHDNLGRASVKSESELAEFASAALAKLKEMPEKVRSFFGDPALRYISAPTA